MGIRTCPFSRIFGKIPVIPGPWGSTLHDPAELQAPPPLLGQTIEEFIFLRYPRQHLLWCPDKHRVTCTEPERLDEAAPLRWRGGRAGPSCRADLCTHLSCTQTWRTALRFAWQGAWRGGGVRCYDLFQIATPPSLTNSVRQSYFYLILIHMISPENKWSLPKRRY